jgi:hypothetical protein
MTVVDGVSFPPGQWFPDIQILNDIGNALLTVSIAGLKLFGLDTRYERKFFGHGVIAAPVEPSKANQLTIITGRMFLGKAGQEQFSPPEGAPGRFAFQTVDYEVEITNPWPMRQGTQALKTTDIAAVRANLNRDAFVLWSTLTALALGGVVAPAGALQDALSKRNGVVVGPMQPRGPAGGEASYLTTVSVQL